MSNSSHRGSRRALLIGINKYVYPWWELQGCVNDVELMRSLLQESFGFPPENITLLRDEEATREAILAEFEALVEATGSDDVVVIHYAGHGSQMKDREGDEPDGMDETILPHDTGRAPDENRDITDDEIHEVLLQLGEKTPYITLVFDCCHSGTITRDAFGTRVRSVEPDERPVEQLPPSPVSPEALTRSARDPGPSGWLSLSSKYVLIAGCRDEEQSAEKRVKVGDRTITHGALTYYLGQELRRAGPGTTYRDVFERMSGKVTGNNAKQHPQMEGMLDRELFGVMDIEPMRYVRVTERANGSVTLAAGAAHGMTVGSQWSVVEAGAKQVSDGSVHLGQIEITAVGPVTSAAKVVEETSPGAIGPGGRAVEEMHVFGDMRLEYEIVAPDGFEAEVAAMREELERSRLLAPAAGAVARDARIYLIAPRETAADDDPVPQLGALDAPTWAVVTDNGDLQMPPKVLSEYRDVGANLERLHRYRQALAVENPDPVSGLRGKVALDLLRQRADDEWVVAEPERAGGDVVFEEGEGIGIRITNAHDAPLYINLLDFGITGKVSPLFPPPGAQEALAPGASFELGTGKRPDDQPLTLQMPKEFPYAENPYSAAPAQGTETVKLFVTTEPADFGFLEQEGVRSVASLPSAFELLMQSALGGTASRDIAVATPISQGADWTTAQKPFALRAKSSDTLRPDGGAVEIGQVKLVTPGLAGNARAHAWNSPRADAASLRTGNRLGAALASANVESRRTIQIDEAREVGVATRTTELGEPAIELQAPDPGSGYGQMVLSTDESGVATWHFAEPVEGGAATRGAEEAGPAGTRTYVIRRTVSDAGEKPAARGLVGAVGKKFLNVLVFPLIEPGIGAVGDFFASKWEAKKRPYRIRSFTPDNFTSDEATEADGELWSHLAGGRALLLVHGTFSRAHTAFGGLPREFVESLHERYEGRMFAFDHFTISEDPKENVEWLLERLPSEISLDVDIVCHSRGGLVSRVLSEKRGDLAHGSKQLKVGKVVFVGSPNAGTALADPEHMGALIDRYTNLLNFFDLLPDNGVTEVLEAIITVAKQLSVGTLKGLKGIQSMRPEGEFGKWINEGTGLVDSRYFAVASDFSATEPGLKDLLFDKVMDRIFEDTGNDLVVPTGGVFDRRNKPRDDEDSGEPAMFPIEERYIFEGINALAHGAYFADPLAREKIAGWLTE